MSDETTPTPTETNPQVASNSGGNGSDSAAIADTNAILRDKEGDALRPRGRRRRKVSYLTLHKIDYVDYKEVSILKRFINDRGKILSTRQSGNTAKQQRMIAQAIRRAREMALLPFIVTEAGPDRPIRPRGPRAERTERVETNEE